MQMMLKDKKEYIIEEELKGMRLDKCIAILDKDISRMAVQRLLDEENITINREMRKGFI